MQVSDASTMITFVGADSAPVSVIPLREGGGPGSPLEEEWQRRKAALDDPSAEVAKRGGRPPTHDDAFYALVAYRYALGGPDPVKAVATDVCVSLSQARNLIATARKKGMLTATMPGRAGGQITSRAAELLDQGTRDIAAETSERIRQPREATKETRR